MAAREVRVGDRTTLVNPTGRHRKVIRLRDVPGRQVSRKEAPEYYDILESGSVEWVSDGPDQTDPDV